MNAQAKKDVFDSLRRPGVAIVLLTLLLAALGLNAAVQSFQLHFKKLPVALRRDLTQLPERLGHWVQVMRDTPFSPEAEHALGTKDYISRWYVDSRLVPAGKLDNIARLSDSDREKILQDVLQKDPRGAINLHLAYYTGQADTVAHVPERCMVGGGFDPDPNKTTVTSFNLPDTDEKTLDFKYIEFQQRERPEYPKRNVAYAFQVNGAYAFDSTGVRVRLQSLTEKYAYYCKIEMMTMLNNNTEGAKATMRDFLSFAIPEIDKCLPDWEAISGQKQSSTQPVKPVD